MAAQTASLSPHPAVSRRWEGRVAPTLSTCLIEGPPPSLTTTTACVTTATASTTKAATVSMKIFEVFKKTPSIPCTPTIPTGRWCLAVRAQPLPPPYPAPFWLTLHLLLWGWPIKNDALCVQFIHQHLWYKCPLPSLEMLLCPNRTSDRDKIERKICLPPRVSNKGMATESLSPDQSGHNSANCVSRASQLV